MPGRTWSSFRSGNLAENLGLLLLKGLAVVAEVARPEDIGLDAIATLLRPDPDGNCYAEDTFQVQLKSESVSSIAYKEHELEWLVNQRLPTFIGRVSLAESRISLFSTLHVNQAVLSLHANKAKIRFGSSDVPAFVVGQLWGPWRGESDDASTVWLGAPVLEWTLNDIVDAEWKSHAFRILKAFLRVARRELELLSIGQSSVINWEKNDVESITTRMGLMTCKPNDLPILGDKLAPLLKALMLQTSSMSTESSKAVMFSLGSLIGALRNLGVEVDPEDLCRLFLYPHINTPSTSLDTQTVVPGPS